MFNYRTTTNVPTQRNPQQQDNGDADTGAGGAAEAGGGGAGDNMEQGQSAQNYDARKAKNAKSKRREEIDNFQAKILKTLENPIETPAPAEPQDYVDLAFTAISRKMKDTLNKNEIMDVVEEIEAIINRVCREKRRRIDLTGQQAPLPPPVTASTSTDTLFGGGPGPQGPMAIPAYNELIYYNF